MYKKFSCLICLLLLSSFAYSNGSFLDIDGIANEALQRFNVPGVAVGIVVDDKVVLSKGYGLRNIEENAPVTEQTLFPIASCTKAFTAHILEQLVEEGFLSWDDPVKKYIPEFRLSLFNPHLSSKVSVRDLAAHRTGVPRHDAIWYCNHLSDSDVLRVLPYLPPICDLREEWHYNNFMYGVLGTLIKNPSCVKNLS